MRNESHLQINHLNIILIDEHKNIDQTQALKAVVPGFEKAKLRNFGMTIGNNIVWLELMTNIGMNGIAKLWKRRLNK